MSSYMRPTGMNDTLFNDCVDWATRMNQAVHHSGPVPLTEVPLLYDTFRRSNPEAIDPVFARSLQRHQRELNLIQQLHATNTPLPPPPSPSMVPLPAIELMLANTQVMLSTVQRDARWQLQSALRALGRTVPPPPAPPMRVSRRRNWNRRDLEDDNAPTRPRNSMRAGPWRGPPPTGPRPRDHRRQTSGTGRREGQPPSYHFDLSDDDAHRPHTPAERSARDDTPHPRAGVLFREDEDFVMREATPARSPLAQPVAPLAAAAIFDLRTPEPPISVSDCGTQGTTTPRAASPAQSVTCTSRDREVFAYQPYAVMTAFPAEVRVAPSAFPEHDAPQASGSALEPADLPGVPANSEYAGSVTADFEQLDLGMADQLLNAYIATELGTALV